MGRVILLSLVGSLVLTAFLCALLCLALAMTNFSCHKFNQAMLEDVSVVSQKLGYFLLQPYQ